MKQLSHMPILMALSAICLSASVQAQQPYVYPNKGQSAQQTEQDKYACYQWAKQQSGHDPMNAPTSAPPPPSQPQGERARGALRGAAGGAIIGGITGDAGKGAAVCATAGVMVGGARQREARRQQEQQYQQQSAAAASQTDSYNRAFAACMEGRGYNVR